MDVVDLTLSDSEDETVHHRDRRRLPAWSSSPINHSSSMVFRPNAIVGGTLVPTTATISRDARKIGEPHLPPQNVINSINYEGVNEVGEIMHVGGIASRRDAGSYLHETAIQGRHLPPSFMQEKPVSGTSGLGGILVNKERILDLGYKSLSVSAPLLTDEFQSHLGPYLANGPIGKSKIEDVPSGPNFHGNILHPSAEIPTSKPLVSADGHTFIYRSDNDQLLNLDDPNTFHGKEAVQRAPFSEYVMRENEDVLIYESFSSRRKLPASLSNGKHCGISSTSGYNETMPHHSVPEEKTKDADERIIFRAALDGLSQPAVEANLPDGLLSVPLLRHQKIALAWMVHQETRSFHCSGGILADDQGLGKTVSTIALILMQRNEHSKFISNSTEHVRKEALDLDAEGENADELAQVAHQNDSNSQSKTTVSTGFTSVDKGRPAAGTLVVCPASVLRQWAQELSDKIASDAKLLFLVYYGANRTKDPFELAKYDVILTTYAIVSMEVPKQPLFDEDDGDQRTQEKYGLSSDFSSSKKAKRTEHRSKKRKGKKGVDGSFVDQEISPLARVRWFRVVLDEAQTIKNYRTQVARACCSLRAKRRWCLSGTPMQNAIDDLYSYFRFLKYDPYTVYSSFCSTLKHPISRNASKGYKKLQAVLRTIMLRRTKDSLINGKPIINLPPKTILLKKVDFSIEERAFYSKLEADSRVQFKEYATAGTVNQNYANILLLLLRLRQACDHPILVKGCHSESINKLSTEAVHKLPTEIQMNLLNHLESSSAICEICSDPPEDAVIAICGHVFCNQCISERLTGDENFCPSADCKSQIGTDSIFSSYALRSNSDPSNCDSIVSAQTLAESADVQGSCSSSKIKATLDILLSLNQMQQSNNNFSLAECDEACTSASETDINRCSPDFNSLAQLGIESATKVSIPEKAIVFSQWTSMLDLLEVSLNGSCIQYRRLDGTMSLAARDRAVKDFNTLPEVTVMIMSLKAGNLGLNMVAANHIVLLDLWWNPTTEDQAIDRAHRIGQIRPVTVSRLTITNTIEDRILALQEEKRKMVASAFGEDQAGGFATRLTVDDLRYLFMV